MNLTIDTSGWEGIANAIPESQVTNAEFLTKFCNALDNSLDQAMTIIMFGFFISSVVHWILARFDWSKYATTESKIVNDIIKDIPKMTQNIGHVLIFVGVVYFAFIRYGV